MSPQNCDGPNKMQGWEKKRTATMAGAGRPMEQRREIREEDGENTRWWVEDETSKGGQQADKWDKVLQQAFEEIVRMGNTSHNQ